MSSTPRITRVTGRLQTDTAHEVDSLLAGVPPPIADDDEDDSPQQDAEKDDPVLKKLLYYTLTKCRYRRLLPEPFEITNARVLKEPILWPLYFEMLQLTADIVTPRGLPGEVVREFLHRPGGTF